MSDIPTTDLRDGCYHCGIDHATGKRPPLTVRGDWIGCNKCGGSYAAATPENVAYLSTVPGTETWKNNRMNPWRPDDNPHQARRLGKTAEELGELQAVIARIQIQGIDAIDPSSGKTNRQRLIEETADVSAQLRCNIESLNLPVGAILERSEVKYRQMAEWEAHYPKEDQS